VALCYRVMYLNRGSSLVLNISCYKHIYSGMADKITEVFVLFICLQHNCLPYSIRQTT
jgi:hypothetical protein